ncbi:MAG TPA: hypothetical protein VG737_05745, partial [Cyclobacteriaceae bacterium]|nr:hypothetical protein [Cyclobacteriaceae bacterium]
AKAPIIVENRALGYELRYDLDYFTVDAGRTNFNGSTFFKELIPADEEQRKRWEQNRDKSYLGSRAHLVRSILADRLEQEGWEVKIQYPGFRPSDKYIAEQIKKYRALGMKDSIDYYRQMRLMPHFKHMTSRPLHGHEIMDVTNRQLMTFKGVLEIVFKNEEDPRYIGRKVPIAFSQSSELVFETRPHMLYENGSYLPQKDVALGGYFAFGERAAEWVPYGYTPTKK